MKKILPILATGILILTLATSPIAISPAAAEPFQLDRPVQQTVSAEPATANAQINYPAFLQLATEVAEYREKRRLPLEKFLAMAKKKKTILLDTRSRANYERKHLAGAIHLNFSELTKGDLERVIPSKDTRILIYCNNNFTDNSPAFALKSAPLALNIPTFLTLYGYGYKNLYELAPAISENDPRVRFESVQGQTRDL